MLRIPQKEVNALAGDARQRRDRVLPLVALLHERGIDQIVGREAMLSHQPAGEIVAPHPACSPFREFSCESHV